MIRKLGDGMKNSHKIKIFIILMMIFTIIFNFDYIVEARYDDDLTERDERLKNEAQERTKNNSDPSENPNYYHPKTLSPEEPEVQEKAGKILGYINTIGIVVSIITLVIIGIKYMLGSIEEKAEYKKTMIYYMLGALLLFSATTIPNILYRLTTGLSTSI